MMSHYMPRFHGPATTQRGFSLLEMLVAFVIMAMSLVVIYQAAGGSVRAVIESERYAYALTLAESVLQSYQGVPHDGWAQAGELENGFAWRIESRERPPLEEGVTTVPVYDVIVTVSWGEGREVKLESVLPEHDDGLA